MDHPIPGQVDSEEKHLQTLPFPLVLFAPVNENRR